MEQECQAVELLSQRKWKDHLALEQSVLVTMWEEMSQELCDTNSTDDIFKRKKIQRQNLFLCK